MEDVTELQAAERRVREGEAHIEQQCRVINRLERDGQSSEAARDLLIVMMAVQEANWQQLNRLRNGSKRLRLVPTK